MTSPDVASDATSSHPDPTASVQAALRAHEPHGALRVLVLVSGTGTNLQALLDATADPGYGVEVVAVGSDRPDAGGLRRAEQAGIPAFVCAVENHSDRDAWDAALADLIAEHAPDLVVSAGFMRILGTEVLREQVVVNTHPALLPAFPGAHAVRDALAYGVKVTGATVHFVDTGVDTGPVIAQEVVRVDEDDTVETLHERIKQIEHRMLVDVVGRIARAGYSVTNRKVHLP